MSTTEAAVNNGATDAIRVGFLGASDISRKIWGAIEAAGSMQVTIVAARDPARAEEYIAECAKSLDLPDERRPVSATYDELVTSPHVDVVYISIPVSKRHEWVLKCVENGKHIVGEKPPATDGAQLRTWLEALAAKRLLYVDGTMFSHGPYIQRIVAEVPKVGKVRRLTSHFTFQGSDGFAERDIRGDPSLEPMGCLGDLGWYCVRSFLHVMNFAMPTAVIGRVHERNAKGGIMAFSGELTFTDPSDADSTITAHFYCGFVSSDEDLLVISGSDAIINAPQLILPVTDKTTSFTVVRGSMGAESTDLVVTRDVEEIEVTQETGAMQETQMWRNVRDSLRRNEEGALEVDETEAQTWGKRAWITQCILDKLLESANTQVQPAAAS